MGQKLFLLAGAMVLCVVMSGCTSTTNETTNALTETGNGAAETAETVNAHFIVIKDTIRIFDKSLDVENGTNAFDAMLELFGEENVEYDEYVGMGVIINSINGIAGDAENYWGLSVNGEYADMGISGYVIEKDIEFEWRYTPLSEFYE